MTDIVLKPTRKQHEAWGYLKDGESKVVVFGGGAGGGKSWLGCEWVMSQCYMYPGCKYFIGREELKRLLGSVYVTWGKVSKYHNIPAGDWGYNGVQNYIEFRNGSRVDLLDLKYLPGDPLYERFGSLEYSGGWIEEAAEVDFGAYDVLKTRIGRHMSEEIRPKMLLTLNPTKNWPYMEFYEPWKEGRLPKGYAFVQSLYSDNPYTAAVYGEQLEGISNVGLKERLMRGNWEYEDGEDRLLDFSTIDELFRTKGKTGEKYITIDVARMGRDKSVVMYWEGKQVKKILKWEKNSIDWLVERVREMADELNVPRDHIVADEAGLGGGFVDYFKCKGFLGGGSAVQPRESKWNPDKRVRYVNLRSQCYFLMCEGMKRREVGVEASMEDRVNIRQELEQVKEKWVNDKEKRRGIISKDEMKEQIGRSPDYADCLSMRWYFEVMKENSGLSGEDLVKIVEEYVSGRKYGGGGGEGDILVGDSEETL